MPSNRQSPGAHATGSMGSAEIAALVHRAREFKRTADAGLLQPLLRGKTFGVLHGADADTAEAANDDVTLFGRAAVELGARVAHLRPALTAASPVPEVQQTARLLGRLYDAVFCDGVDAGVVERLRASAGVPVHDRITAPDHQVSKIADQLDPSATLAERQCLALQAVLTSTV